MNATNKTPPDQAVSCPWAHSKANRTVPASSYDPVPPVCPLQPLHGRNKATHAQDQQNIGDVGTDHVAKRKTGRADKGRIEGDHQFRRRGADGDHRHADHQRRKAKNLGQAYSAANENFRRRQQDGDAAEELQIHHVWEIIFSGMSWNSATMSS